MVFNDNELVFYKKNGEIQSGGYKVESLLMKQGKSPMVTLNDTIQTGGGENTKSKSKSKSNSKSSSKETDNYLSLFKDLAVPTGLFYIQNNINGIIEDNQSQCQNNNYITEDKDEILDEKIYNQLLQIVNPNINNGNGNGNKHIKSKSRKVHVKNNSKNNKKTKKYRNYKL